MLKVDRFMKYWQGLLGGLGKQEKSLSQMSRAGTFSAVLKAILFLLCLLFFVFATFFPDSVFAFSIGDKIKATAILNVRSCASTSCSLITTMSTGGTGTISNGPYSGSGYTWWYINWDNGYTGYSVQDYIVAIPGSFTFTGLTPSTITTNTAGYQATLSASGSNFNNVNKIVLSWSGSVSGSKTWNKGDTNWNSKVTVNSDTSMTLKPVVTASGDPSGTSAWTVTLTDTAGATASRSFAVTYTPTTILSFTGLTPSTITTNTAGYQATLSASGSNFNNVNKIVLSWSGSVSGSKTWNKGDTNWNSKVTVNSDTSMTLKPVVTASGDPSGTSAWTVTLTDTAGATASRSFAVTYTAPPSVPTGLTATAVSSSQINLSWSASTDNVGVAGYKIYRSGSQIATTSSTSYSNTGLSASTEYCYNVAAYDSAGNTSGQSSQACATTQSGSTSIQLPDSGQTKCYDSSGAEITCSGTGQDGEYNINPMSYTDNNNDTITDNVTGLMWQKEDDNTTRNWTDAGTYCDNSTFGGYTDWRLPSKKELISIVDYSIPEPGPTINTTYFPNTNASNYWSSTTYASSTDNAWSVYFSYGYVSYSSKTNNYYVRCVRAGQSGSLGNFSDNGNGTVTNNSTGLMWQQGEPGFMTWQNALYYCNGLPLGGHPDWRLPNIKELESITDDTRYNPAIDTTYFPNAHASGYWSSTTNAYYTDYAWGVGYRGAVVYHGKTNDDGYVRCVRGGQSAALGNSAYFIVTDSSGNAITDKAVSEQFEIKVTARNGDGSVKTGWSGKVNISANGLSKSYILITSGGTATATIFIDTPGNAVQIKAMGGGMSGNSNAFNVTGTACYGSIGGKVTQGGTDLSGATVYLTSSSYSPSPATSSNGKYSFINVPAGSYTLRATYNGGESNLISVTVGCGSGESEDINVYQQCNQNEKTPVLLVPGIPGSTWKKNLISFIPTLPKYEPLPDELMLYDSAATAKGWDTLKKMLTMLGYKEGCTLFDVPYDWRLRFDDAVEKYLKPRIEEAKSKAGTEKVNIIAHSMGGLITRAYIQSGQYKKDIDKFAMIGTPNHGSAMAYPLWEGGDLITAGLMDLTSGDLPTTTVVILYLVKGPAGLEMLKDRGVSYLSKKLLKKLCGGNLLCNLPLLAKLYIDISTYIITEVPSIQMLLPTYPFLSHLISSDEHLDCIKNPWLDDYNNSPTLSLLTKENDPDPDKVRTKIFYGSNIDTITYIGVGIKWCSIGFYPDGLPISWNSQTIGDGTVLSTSAMLGSNVSYLSKTAEHPELIKHFSLEVVEFIDGQGGAPAATLAKLAESAVSSLSIAVTGRAQPLLMSPAGQKSGIDTGVPVSDIPGTTQSIGADAASISIESPADGTYTITMSGIYNEDYSLIIEYVSAAGESSILSVRGFNHANTTSFTFTLNSTATDKLTMNHTPLPPANLQADAIDSGGLKTRLSWDVVTGAVNYIIYGKNSDEPYLQQIGTTTGLSFDTGDAWAADSSVTTREYAVAAVNASGSESFLSNIVENNDRDHDGLTDTQETSLTTNLSNSDSDGDGLNDGEEYIRGTDPLLTDTDSDGYSDNAEVQGGTDPLDAVDYPCSASPAKLNSQDFNSIQTAYDNASDSSVIQARVADFSEDLIFNSNIDFTLRGGYDCNYTTNSRYTTVNGSITISSGTAVIENVIIK